MKRSCIFILVLLCCSTFCFGGNGKGNNGNGNGNGGSNNGNNGNGNGSKNDTPPGQLKNHLTNAPSIRQYQSSNGNYNVTLKGDFNGTGQAAVTDTTVTITATVTDAKGNTTSLTTNVLPLDGPYFAGAGTALGQTITITGRLDATAASRLICTIIAQDGRSARAVGMLPVSLDPPQANWDPNAGD